MALGANTIFDVRSTGSDTANGGAFDPGQTAGMLTDGAATSANTSSPVFSSASYNFVAGDVGAWVYIASGTNWTPGWYQIASVASNQATLSAAIGVAVLSTNRIPSGANTAAGCATTASPTAATWTIDYSQQATAAFSYTDLASAGAGLTVSSTAFPFAKQQVGNCLVVASGTNFTAGRYVITSVAAGVATVIGPGNITTGAGASGVGGLGGAVKTTGIVGGIYATNNLISLQSGSTYSITSATINIANGTVSNTANALWFGWGTSRHLQNTDTAPTIQVNVASATVFNDRSHHYNLIIDGNSQATSIGAVGGSYDSCTFKNLTAASSAIVMTRCAITGNSATTGAGLCEFCEAWSNTATQFTGVSNNCLSYNNTGASTDGFQIPATTTTANSNCTAYANGRDGFRFAANGRGQILINCHSEGNSGYGYNPNTSIVSLVNCSDYNNTSGRVSLSTSVPTQQVGSVSLSGSAFVNAAGNNLALNNTAGAGASIRGLTGAFPRATTTGYQDLGAVQHQDTGGGGGLVAFSTVGRMIG